jgi:hypothetical protein
LPDRQIGAMTARMQNTQVEKSLFNGQFQVSFCGEMSNKTNPISHFPLSLCSSARLWHGKRRKIWQKYCSKVVCSNGKTCNSEMTFLSFFLSFFHSIGKVGIIKRAKSGKRDKFSKSVKKYHQFATGASQKINFVHRNVQNSPISRANRSFLLFLTLEFVCCDQNGDWVSPGADAGREKRKESANCTRNLFCTT